MGFADVVADVLEVDPRDLNDEAGPGSIPNWTSLRHVQLVVALEEAYGVTFTADEIRAFRSIGDVRAVLERRGKSGGAVEEGAADDRHRA